MKVFISGSSHFIETESKKLTGNSEDEERETYFGDELNDKEKKSEFFSFAASISIFGNKKSVFIRNANEIKNLEGFIASLDKCANTDIIISADREKLKNPKTYINENSDIKLIQEKYEKATPEKVRSVFNEKGIPISQSTAQLIFDKVNGNITAAENEAEKIFLYMKSVKLDEEDIIKYISGEKEESIFSIVDLFSERETKKAFMKYSAIQKNDASLRILFTSLSKRIINIYYSHISKSLIQEKFPYIKDKIINYRNKWTRNSAAFMVGKAAQLDVDIKTGTRTPENAVNELIMLSGMKNIK